MLLLKVICIPNSNEVPCVKCSIFLLVTSAGEPATAQQLTCILLTKLKLNELEAISSVMAKLEMVKKNHHLQMGFFFDI